MGSRQVIKIRQDNGEVRVLGYFKPSTQTLYVERKRSKHFYRKLGAWGIDEKAFKGLRLEHGLQKVVLFDKESNSRLEATAQDFEEKGHYLHFKPYRLQIFLEEQYWREAE
jgi:hypothetical protein